MKSSKIYNRTKIKQGTKVYKVIFEDIYECTIVKVTAISDRFVELTIQDDRDEIVHIIATNTSNYDLYFDETRCIEWHKTLEDANWAVSYHKSDSVKRSIGSSILSIVKNIGSLY